MNSNRLSVGHYSNFSKGTGATVFILDRPCPSSYYICGSAPATSDVNVLSFGNLVETIDALVFTGGSAFGLGATQGVQQWLKEKGRGFATNGGPVPIVPAAALYDLTSVSADYPKPADLYHACEAATPDNIKTGQVGAGTGATIGKLYPEYQFAKGGFGYSHIKAAGAKVTAYVAVNCVGDIVDEQGQIIAGATDSNGQFVDIGKQLLAGKAGSAAVQANTTLVAIFIEAACDRQQLQRIAKMATAGFANAIVPSFTSYDGDIIFTVSMGGEPCDELILGAMAAKAISQAIRLSFL